MPTVASGVPPDVEGRRLVARGKSHRTTAERNTERADSLRPRKFELYRRFANRAVFPDDETPDATFGDELPKIKKMRNFMEGTFQETEKCRSSWKDHSGKHRKIRFYGRNIPGNTEMSNFMEGIFHETRKREILWSDRSRNSVIPDVCRVKFRLAACRSLFMVLAMGDSIVSPLVNSSERPWTEDKLFHVLSDSTRRRLIVNLAILGPKMGAYFDSSLQGRERMLKHLEVMRAAGLVIKKPNPSDGRRPLYELVPQISLTQSEDMCLVDLGYCVLRGKIPTAGEQVSR